MDSKLSFRVVQGTEDKISSLAYTEGFVYFTTDTKKIYLDTQGSRLSMGGNTGIYYANANQPDEGEEFFFDFSDIEGDSIPNEKDLILNSADGCFYKVEEVRDSDIKATKLTISGSGGGGGTGTTGKLDFDIIGSRYRTVLAGKPVSLEFNFSAVDETGASTGNGRYEIMVNKVVKKRGVAKQGSNIIEIGDLFNVVGEYSVDVFCYGYTGGAYEYSKSRHLDIISTAFTVEWDYDETDINYLSQDFRMNWSVNIADSDKIVSYVLIDDKYQFDTEDFYLKLTTSELKEYGIGHGTHKVELYAYAWVGGDEEYVSSDHIVQNVMFYDNSVADPGFIINCKFFETTATQYDTLQIPIMIYHPDNVNGTATVTFNVNSAYKSKQEKCQNLTWYTFSYTPDESGFVSLQFICGAAMKSLILDVAPLDLSVEEVLDYEFKFKATDFSNNEEVQSWSFVDQNGVSKNIVFSDDFDWINGGLQSGSDDVGPYFKIQAGSYMTIPYKIFSSDLKDTGACFKMIFKASNCRDYDAVVVNCMASETYNETVDGVVVQKESSRGLFLKAQGCEVKSLASSLDARYCEDSYIEYEFDVCKYSNKVEDQYLTLWMDGVPAGVVQFSSGDSFRQNVAKDLVIGSEDCDVYLYLIKFYKKHLTSDEHLANFIMDAPNATEVINRFNRNDITIRDSSNNVYISPERLAEKNPDCNVFIFDIPNIPTSKKDVHYGDGNTECCSFTLLKGSKEAVRSYDGVKLRAQGTSSMSYGISAYNLDAKFPEKWGIDEEAIPVNYMNIKVNVASCEGANNALNQEWYNRYQPYKNQKRLQERTDGKIARDTMEFINGVVFIQDNNTETNSSSATSNNVFKEISGYANNPYPRMYSIGNMGNSKKNTAVFHGAGNKYECCVENADNNTSGQRMVAISGFIEGNAELEISDHEVPLTLPDSMFDEKGYVIPGADWGTTYDPIYGQEFDNKTLWKNALIGEGLFEFRYCIDEDDFEASEDFASFEEYQEELSNRFLRLVRWFVKNNPSQATGEELPEEVTIPDYTIKGVAATAYRNYKSEDEVLKGVQISGGTFKTDTAEYRAKKMLQESEDYLILDSIFYHYVFIERHTMVDNVAKNTFWNTEDGVHWELTKNYDNDTADGVDNSGNLIFDYGIEVMDNTASDGSIFNARPSAWLHFAHNLLTLREKMYQHLSAKGAWSADAYLNLFEQWQKIIPEVCWIEDYNRKYFRPNNVYGDSSYLSRLASGKKTHQRKQFETYQNQYMNSQYATNAGEGNSIQWRSKQPDDESLKIDGKYEIKAKVKLYADGYLSVAIASGAGEPDSINVHVRGKKGQEIEFSKAQATTFDDATCYMYSPNLYQEFTGIETLYPSTFSANAANKLRKISLIPQNDIQKNVLKVAFSFGPNIEEIIIRDCESADFNLDLSSCSRLRKIDTTGSNFKSYTIADGAPLEEFKIEFPTTLTLSNLRYLKKYKKIIAESYLDDVVYYVLDENSGEYLVNENIIDEESFIFESENATIYQDELAFNIVDYDRLQRLEINNIDYNDVNSKDIVNRIYRNNNSLEYNLTNVKWYFNSSDNITDNDIPLLDYLLSQSTISNKLKSLSLTGTATIDDDAYSGNNVLGLYEKYGLYTEDDSSYPNLLLQFVDNEENQKLFTIDILNGNGENVWSRQYESFNNLSNSDLSNSADGAFNASETIKKSDSAEFVYDFENRWKYTLSTGESGYVEGTDETYQYLDLSLIPTLIGEALVDIVIEPSYTTSTRYYTISFYDKDTEELIHQVTDAEYNDDFDSVRPLTLPIKDDSELSLRQTYRLKGYSASKTSSTTINEDNWRVTDNSILYTIYEEVDVSKVDYSSYLDIEGTRVKGLLKNKEGYDYYQGRKLRIPAGITEIAANAFASNRYLRKIFVSDNVLTTIRQSAFNASNVQYFEFLDNSIKTIEPYAFLNCPLSANDYQANFKLPIGLETIGTQAFNGCFPNKIGSEVMGEVTVYVPYTVTSMGRFAIAHFGINNATIQIGDSENLSALTLIKEDISVGIGSMVSNPIIHSNRSASQPSDIKDIIFYTNQYSSSDVISYAAFEDGTTLGLDYITVNILTS